jgi:myo-inositol-1(or 4)-monophosphatase
MIKHLEEIFKIVRNYILKEGYKRTEIVKINPKGEDISTKFDLEVENIVIGYCKKHKLDVKILSEETGEFDLFSTKPEHIFVLDPVDGSTNLKRGIEGSAFSVAVMPIEENEEIQPERVQYALIGNLISGAISKGEKGKGTFYKGPFSGFQEKRVFTSKNENLETACIGIDLDFALDETSDQIDVEKGAKIERILPLLYPQRKVKYLRRSGSASLGLMEVATGAVDAYIDARDISTPENWLAAYLLVKEAGGEFTDIEGNEIRKINSLTAPYSYIASANKSLHKKILRSLKVND